MTKRSWRRPVGFLLLLPLAATLVGGLLETAGCDYDCGDQGGRGYFILLLLCTPVAAFGLLLVGVRGLPSKLVAAGAAACVLLLAGVTVAAGVDGVAMLALAGGLGADGVRRCLCAPASG